MNEKETLIEEILKQYEKDGEPITREQAEEVAEMELKAKNLVHYAHSELKEKKERKPRERKIDTNKDYLLKEITNHLLKIAGIDTVDTKTETEINFTFRGDNYTLRLIKHRPK